MKDTPNDSAEYVRLLIAHQTRLRAYIISRMPGVGGVSDVLQETNLILWEKRDSFEIGTNFSAWAFSIARNKTLSHLRNLKQRKVSTLDEQLTAELSEELEAESEKMDAWQDALDGCLQKLSADERTLLNYRYQSSQQLDQYPSKASVGSLRARLFRIRASLRACINATLNSDPGTRSFSG